MFEKIKSKLSKQKINIEQYEEQNDLSFKRLSSNVFPYSCLVADDVMLTKNGEVFSMIEITLDDFKKNQDGGLRDAIRKAISQNINDLKTAFWIQTVKRKKEKTVLKQISIQHVFFQKIHEISEKIEKKLNNYETYVYITIIRQGEAFKVSPSYLKYYFSSRMLIKNHNKYLDQSIESLKNITHNIVDALSLYQPKILSIRQNGNDEYSEIIEKLHFLINFEDKEQKIEDIDATKLINRSTYLFENGTMAIKNNDTGKMKVGMSFSLKEIPNIGMSNVSDIINNTRAEMIITEYVSYVNQKYAISKFQEQKKILDRKEDKSFQEKVGLSFLDQKNNTKYCQSSLSIILLANNIKEMKSFISDCTKMFSKYGIVMAREDISLERNYYAMMPANFLFTHRTTIHDAEEVASFCYSYVPQENSADNFLNKNILFNIGTLKSNPVPIGFDKNKKNVMISGGANVGKTVLANFLLASWMKYNKSNVYIIEFKNKSSIFTDAIGGKNYTISTDRQIHNAFFNCLNVDIFDNQNDKEDYIFEMISLFLGAINILITPEISSEIRQIAKYIVSIKEKKNDNNERIALHDIRQFLKGKTIENELQSWHSIGRFYHLFDNREDVFDESNVLHFFIDDTIQNNSLLLTTIVNHIITNILQRAKNNTKEPTIVILDEPFLAFGNSFFKQKLEKIIKDMEKNRIYCIFKVRDFKREATSIVDFNILCNSCGLQMHFANKFVDNYYAKVFNLEKIGCMSIKTLAMYEGRNLIVKLPQYLYSCRFELDDFKDTLKLLSDREETMAKIFSIKESLKTDNCDRWLSAYYSNLNTNIDVEDKINLQKELQAIRNVKRILDS